MTGHGQVVLNGNAAHVRRPFHVGIGGVWAWHAYCSWTRKAITSVIPCFVKLWSISETMTTRQTSFLRYLPYLSVLPLATVATSASAQEAPLCSELDLPNPIYGAGGSAITPTLGRVASALAGVDDPITILFSDPSACTGFQAFLDNTTTAQFKYWEPGSTTPKTCNAPITGQTLDFAHMGNPASDCTGITVPDGIGDFLAPVQTLNIITKKESAETSISREALYFIYGWGAQSQVEPWVSEAAIYKRTPTSFVHNFLAQGIGLPNTSFKGVEITTNQSSVDGIVASAGNNPDATLGYVSGSTANSPANRQVIKTLAYQHTGQECGYWPSSTPDTFDNINVRTGLYHFWTPGHFFARVGGDDKPVNPLVAELIEVFQSTRDARGGVDATALIIESGDVPGCAMQATREGLGEVQSYAPPTPCGCYYESIATGQTDCTACETDAQCSGGDKCRFGYCEAY